TSLNIKKFIRNNSKIIWYHGLSDPGPPVTGTINYYLAMANQNGGLPAAQEFSRFYPIRTWVTAPHRNKSTITPSTGTCASLVPRGVDQRSDQCPMSLSFIVGAPIASPSAGSQGCAKIYDA